MTHLLDSNALYDLLDDPGLLANLPVEAVTHISVLTVMEMNFGVAAGRTALVTASRSHQLVTALQLWRPVPVDVSAATAFGQIATRHVSRGKSTRRNVLDLMIAATAAARGWTLVTADADLTATVAGFSPVVSIR